MNIKQFQQALVQKKEPSMKALAALTRCKGSFKTAAIWDAWANNG